MPVRSRSLLPTLLVGVAMMLSPLAARAQVDTDTGPMPSASPTVLASGWRTYEQPADGYAVTLPPTWRRIDLDPATIAASVDAAGVGDPATAAWLNQQAGALITSNVSFFGFDFDPSSIQSGFATNVNVIHTTLPGPIPLSTLVQLSAAQLENLPNVVGAVNHHPVSVAAGRAEQFDYQLQLGGRTLAETQYVFVRGTDSYVMSLTTTDEQSTSYADTFQQIGRSFQLLD